MKLKSLKNEISELFSESSQNFWRLVRLDKRANFLSKKLRESYTKNNILKNRITKLESRLHI